jgi:hypothetical protein
MLYFQGAFRTKEGYVGIYPLVLQKVDAIHTLQYLRLWVVL